MIENNNLGINLLTDVPDVSSVLLSIEFIVHDDSHAVVDYYCFIVCWFCVF